MFIYLPGYWNRMDNKMTLLLRVTHKYKVAKVSEHNLQLFVNIVFFKGMQYEVDLCMNWHLM